MHHFEGHFEDPSSVLPLVNLETAWASIVYLLLHLTRPSHPNSWKGKHKSLLSPKSKINLNNMAFTEFKSQKLRHLHLHHSRCVNKGRLYRTLADTALWTSKKKRKKNLHRLKICLKYAPYLNLISQQLHGRRLLMPSMKLWSSTSRVVVLLQSYSHLPQMTQNISYNTGFMVYAIWTIFKVCLIHICDIFSA